MKYLQNLFNKVMDKIGATAVIYGLALLVIVSGMLFAKNAVADYLNTNFTKPFLAQGVIAIQPKTITIQKSQIEYSVLKVPTVKPTVAKK